MSTRLSRARWLWSRWSPVRVRSLTPHRSPANRDDPDSGMGEPRAAKVPMRCQTLLRAARQMVEITVKPCPSVICLSRFPYVHQAITGISGGSLRAQCCVSPEGGATLQPKAVRSSSPGTRREARPGPAPLREAHRAGALLPTRGTGRRTLAPSLPRSRLDGWRGKRVKPRRRVLQSAAADAQSSPGRHGGKPQAPYFLAGSK